MPAIDLPDVLADFEAGRIDPAQFSHREHVRVGYELLERHPFPEALLHLARGLRRLAGQAGRPEVYHETITAAFLALIAERRLGPDFARVAPRGSLRTHDELLTASLIRNPRLAQFRFLCSVRLQADPCRSG